jgi:hypothetical protein
MQAAERFELAHRAKGLLTGRIPRCVAEGGVSQVVEYKRMCAVLAAFTRNFKDADRAKLYVSRIEGMLGAAGGSHSVGGAGGAARSATPPSNTGVNEGRQWLLGSGL